MRVGELASQEYRLWKERMRKESKGTYVLIYAGLVFTTIFSMLYGLSYSGEGEGVELFNWSIVVATVYGAATAHIAFVQESGKRVNIFEKYVDTPIDLKLLRRAELLVAGRIMAIPAVCSQVLALFICVLDPDHEGGKISEWTVWMPFMIWAFCLWIRWVQYIQLCRKAQKKCGKG